MKIPQYVIDLMGRSRFALGYGNPGYTIEIQKSSEYGYVRTLKAEVERLVSWCNRQIPHDDDYYIPVASIDRVPSKTHYCKQNAVVTIFDPVMKQLERYIPQ